MCMMYELAVHLSNDIQFIILIALSKATPFVGVRSMYYTVLAARGREKFN